MVSTPEIFQLSPKRYNDVYILYAFQQLTVYGYWTTDFQKNFTLQMIFLGPLNLIYTLMIRIRFFNL